MEKSKRYRVLVRNGKAIVLSQVSLRLVEALQDNDWLGYADLVELVSCDEKSIYTLMRRIHHCGLVEKETDTDIYGRKRVYYRLHKDVVFMPTLKLNQRSIIEE